MVVCCFGGERGKSVIKASIPHYFPPLLYYIPLLPVPAKKAFVTQAFLARSQKSRHHFGATVLGKAMQALRAMWAT